MAGRLASPVPLLDGTTCAARLAGALTGPNLPRPRAGGLLPARGRRTPALPLP
ncbi:hypothetical protein [Teichococcus oryzae]|uniref:hypothetical protein n=1 Tax=Teichococcus oryzae TaxID=1608942 RepID=UPI001375E9C5|nr:hypothetical protein [Pseudoroseomonas oryzae]